MVLNLHSEFLNEIKNVPVVPFAFMCSVIGGIIIFLTMLIIGPIMVIGLQVAITAASSSGTAISGLNNLNGLGILGLLILVIGVPIGMFISIFVTTAILTIFYNLIAPKIGGIKLNLRNTIGNLHEIDSIPVTLCSYHNSCWNFVWTFSTGYNSIIFSCHGPRTLNPIDILGFNVVYDLVIGFIIYIIIAFLYNYLRPRIGGVKLEII